MVKTMIATTALILLTALSFELPAYADTTAPKVSILDPVDGGFVIGEAIVRANASDPSGGIAKVEFYIDGSLRKTCTETPYSYEWDTSLELLGYHTIMVKAYDNADNENSASATVMVREGITDDVTPPTVWFVYPEDGDVVSGEVPITVDAEDASGIFRVRFWIDDTYFTSRISPHIAVWNSENYPDGLCTLKAEAEDNAGIRNSVEITISVDNIVGQDTIPPTVSIDWPLAGATVSDELTIEATAADNVAVDRVEFWVDGDLRREDEYEAYTYDWDTTDKDNGTYTIETIAFDAAGNQASASVTVTVDNESVPDPDLLRAWISSPIDGATVSGEVEILASTSDWRDFERIEIYVDDDLRDNDTKTPFVYQWDTVVEVNGNHAIHIIAFDNDGNQSTDSINVTVENVPDTTPPTVSIARPLDGATVSGEITIEATAADNVAVDRVKIYVDGVLWDDDTAYEYVCQWDTEDGENGPHTILATAFDEAGNQASAWVTVTVDNESVPDPDLPTAWISSPIDGATVSGEVEILASTSDWRDFERIEIYVDDDLRDNDTKKPFVYQWDTEVEANGDHIINIIAFDNDGNVSPDSVTVTVDNGGGGDDTTLPEVSISSPLPGATVSETTTISASATDAGGIDYMKIFIDDVEKDTYNAASLDFPWDTKAYSNATHSIEVRAWDNSGNIGSRTINVVVENVVAITVVKYYNAGDQQIARMSDDGTGLVYFHRDHLGSTSRVTNSAGTLVKRVGYTPYGSDSYTENLGITVDLDNLFTGQEKDDTGLYYYGSRYYDPELGRFTTCDPFIASLYNPQTLNPYSYCYNNPVNFVDPEGEWGFVAFVVIGAIIGGTAAAINGDNILEGMMWGAIGGGLAYGVGLVVGPAGIGLSGTAAATLTGAITGGIMATMRGGDFWEGVASGAVSGFVSYQAGGYFEESFDAGDSFMSTYAEEAGRVAGGMAGGAASGAAYTHFHGGNLFDNMIGGAFSGGVSSTITMFAKMIMYDYNAKQDQPGWTTGKTEAEIRAKLMELGWDGKRDIVFSGRRGLNDDYQPMYSNDLSDVMNKGFYHENLFGFVNGEFVDLYYGPNGWQMNLHTYVNRLHEFVFKTEIYYGTIKITPAMQANFLPSGMPNGYNLTDHNCQDATDFAIDELAR